MMNNNMSSAILKIWIPSSLFLYLASNPRIGNGEEGDILDVDNISLLIFTG